MLIETLLVLGAYGAGSLPLGFWLVRAVKGIDVRKQGSGNIGMTNIWRVAGAPWGILALLLDVSKAVLAVGAARIWGGEGDQVPVLCGLAVLLGNVFSPFLGFKGGKGVGVSVGVFFSLLPLESALGALVFGATLGIGRMISVGSLLGVTTMALAAWARQGSGWKVGLALFAAMMVWWTHRENIQRILKGTERRIGMKKGAEKP